MTIDHISIINELELTNKITYEQRLFLLQRQEYFGQRLSFLIDNKRDDLNSLDIDSFLETLQNIENGLENLAESQRMLFSYSEVSEDNIEVEVTIRVRCKECKGIFEEEINDFSFQYDNNIQNNLDNLNTEGKMFGNRYDKVFLCNDCILEKAEPIVDIYMEQQKDVCFQNVLTEFLQDWKEIEAERQSEEQLEKQIIEENKKNQVLIDRRNFIKPIVSNNLLNFS